jgi:heme/copper-type cytochrome/quinol oxidase subunit 3
MSLALAVTAILASLFLGYWIFQSYGTGTADATYDAIAFLSATFWILAGIFAILGGMVLLGIVILVIFSYIWFSKGLQTKRRLRRRLAG